MVKKLREALKQHTDNLTESGMAENPADAHGTGSDLYSFEDFLTMIKRCDSLLDVKRIRNTIMTQMRKKRALIGNEYALSSSVSVSVTYGLTFSSS